MGSTFAVERLPGLPTFISLAVEGVGKAVCTSDVGCWGLEINKKKLQKGSSIPIPCRQAGRQAGRNSYLMCLLGKKNNALHF